MPKLIIDNIEIEVPPGANVLEAAKQAGVWIPHFCYHPALGSAGACRLCAMRFLEGPVKGVQMACMIPAQDGMIIATDDPEAVRLRQLVIEWLMTNHPHDCPVCDEGGECLLQDYTIAGGHGVRRFKGKKRTHLNQFLGDGIEHEMNRCIQCYRCVRFYQDYAGGRDFGVMGSARKVYYGRFEEGALLSPFSGNLVDICPTGVFTDKTARFRARYWDYDMAPSICPHCSLGCNTIPAARYRELLKTMARRNDAVNGWFICDRGRFGNNAVNDPARPRTPMVDGREASWDEALDALVIRLGEIAGLYGPESIALVGSPRLSLEAAALLVQLAGLLEVGSLSFFTDSWEAQWTKAAVSLLDSGDTASMADVRDSDCIAIVGCDLLEEGPMLALAVRQAWRNGARLFAVGAASHEELEERLSMQLMPVESISALPLADAQKPVLICGVGAAPEILEQAASTGARLVFMLPGPNAFAAALLSMEHQATSLSEALSMGNVKGVIAFEADLPAELLAGIPLVAAADWRRTGAVEACQIMLPTTAWVEMDGTFINNEGRAQRFRKVMSPGLPIKGLEPALHPPRAHGKIPPGGDLRPAWRLIAEIMEHLGEERLEEPLAGRWADLRGLDPEGEGVRVL